MFDSHGHRKYLNWQERKAFWHAVSDIAKKAEARAFCLTLFYTGCRISEALELTSERVDLSEKTLVFRTLKRRERVYRVVPIPDELVGLLGTVENGRLIWPVSRTTGYRLVKRCMGRAGVEGVKASPKGLRHSFAVACVTRGVPVTTVQKWMGHARLETTAIYLNVMGEEERSQAAKIWDME